MKITAHHLGASNSALELVKQAGSNYVKLVNIFSEAENYKRQFPNIKIIGRNITHDDWSASNFDPITAAEQDFYSLPKNKFIDYWESGNEINPGNYFEMNKIAIYDIRFMQLCEANGIKACIGNFSTGNPGPKVESISDAQTVEKYWLNYRSALVKAYSGGHLIGLHEYWIDPAADTWLQYRYRRLIDFCKKSNTPCPNIAITESGMDNIANYKPWRDQFGDGPEGQQAYTEWIVRYETGIRSNKEVVCAALFTSGTNGSSRWDRHNIDGTDIPTLVGNWYKANPDQGNSMLNKKVRVKVNLNLRNGPSTNNAILTVLLPDSQFIVREVRGDWGRVTTNGWINCSPTYVDIV